MNVYLHLYCISFVSPFHIHVPVEVYQPYVKSLFDIYIHNIHVFHFRNNSEKKIVLLHSVAILLFESQRTVKYLYRGMFSLFSLHILKEKKTPNNK